MQARLGIVFLVGVALAPLAFLLVTLISRLFAWTTLRIVSRRLEDPLAQRLRSEGPTIAVLEVLVRQGTQVGLLQRAWKGYRAAALAQACLYATGLAALVLGRTLMAILVLAQRASRIELALLAGAVPMALLFGTGTVRELAKSLAIHRRIGRFPAGLAYAQQSYMNWPRTPPPYEDALADRLQAISERLDRLFGALYPVAVLIGLIVGIVGMGERAGVFHIR